ncbi:MAG TPA: cytidylate kinase-like family protein [Pirellulales bacterium]|nr:cytidylate kinase-like family protein [Pirellulales bacterium]
MSTFASSLRHQPETSALIEGQIQRWLLLRQAHAEQEERAGRNSDASGRYISLSREAGAGGEQIAREVSRQLGWRVLDGELLALVATAADCSVVDVELIDETGMRWVTELFNRWIDGAKVGHEKYLICLAAAMRAAVRSANVVIVGRGSQFLLPREAGLAVRVIASKPFRVEQAQRLRGLSPKQARDWVEQTDRDRREFVEQHFHRDPTDMHLYDLVINVEHLGIEGAARQVADAARAMFAPSLASALVPLS